MSTTNTAGRYVALFLQASSYAGFIVFYSWISSTFPRPPAKRAVAIAFINAFSQLGNIAGSYVWNLSDNGYRKSYGIVLSSKLTHDSGRLSSLALETDFIGSVWRHYCRLLHHSLDAAEPEQEARGGRTRMGNTARCCSAHG